MVGIVFVYVDTVYGFLWVFFFMLSWIFGHLLFCALYACVSYFCSAQLSMFHIERRSRNIIIIIISRDSFILQWRVQNSCMACWFPPSWVTTLT